ncbi:MAG TPA: SIMPL domain-containing protein [Burkholderiales bacterium]|nr:SIMPL domain-containing protein [Burkholderiales bacterium]
MLKRILICHMAGCFLLAAVSATAAEPPRYNTVELQSEAQREVQNDLLNASLFVELNDPSPAALANAINKNVNDALRIAREYKSVRVRSGNNQTYPVYSKGSLLQGWRGRAEIRIESKDFEAASGLIGKLQAGMQLANMTFSVSPETRRATENELIAEVIGAFKARAEIVKAALAGRGYKLQRLNVTNGYNAPQPRLAMARVAAPAQEVAAPNLEAGVSLVTVTANGAIEVLE